MNCAIGIDLGATRIKGVAMDAAGNLLHKLYANTHGNEIPDWKNTVAETVRELLQKVNGSTSVVGLSAPGLPNENHTAIACMPGRMQGLENFIWNEFLQRPAYVLNDAVAALIAEAKMGAAKNKKHAVLLTLGTGVGGAVLIDGKPYQGAFNKAGHIGHMVIDDEGEPDITGMPGSLEQCIGNCTIEKRSKGKFNSTEEMLIAYHKGDAWACEVWLRSVRQLALGLASITNILSPEIIVLGGGIAEAGDALFHPLNEYMAQYEWRVNGNKTQIVKAVYGDLAGTVGAASFAMSKMQQ